MWTKERLKKFRRAMKKKAAMKQKFDMNKVHAEEHKGYAVRIVEKPKEQNNMIIVAKHNSQYHVCLKTTTQVKVFKDVVFFDLEDLP